jgi:N-acetylglucosaminyl-diphospho-decaprenol L-rhamnosyltransferase
MLGFHRLFPRSQWLAHYYMGHLSKNSIHEVEVLSGAFMLCNTHAVRSVGGFDERYFMYGEDIDLCYTLKKKGHQIFYLGTEVMIHFKGESTKKDFKYVKTFYKAMILFIEKHYLKKIWTAPFTALLKAGVYLKQASVAFSLIQKKHSNPNEIEHPTILSATLVGDDDVKLVLSRNINVIPDSKNIVYCYGTSFSYHQIIESLLEKPKHTIAFFYANPVSALISSNDPLKSGTVIPFPENL